MSPQTASNFQDPFSFEIVERNEAFEGSRARIEGGGSKKATVNFLEEFGRALIHLKGFAPVIAHRMGFPPGFALSLPVMSHDVLQRQVYREASRVA